MSVYSCDLCQKCTLQLFWRPTLTIIGTVPVSKWVSSASKVTTTTPHTLSLSFCLCVCVCAYKFVTETVVNSKNKTTHILFRWNQSLFLSLSFSFFLSLSLTHTQTQINPHFKSCTYTYNTFWVKNSLKMSCWSLVWQFYKSIILGQNDRYPQPKLCSLRSQMFPLVSNCVFTKAATLYISHFVLQKLSISFFGI